MKVDRIDLGIVASKELQKQLKPHEKEIASTVGAKKFKFTDAAPKGHPHKAKATVRGNSFEVFFKKV